MPSLFNGAKSGEGKVRHPFFGGSERICDCSAYEVHGPGCDDPGPFPERPAGHKKDPMPGVEAGAVESDQMRPKARHENSIGVNMFHG